MTTMQKYSSKLTSLNQMPKVAGMIEITEETILLDYGCGRCNKFQMHVEEHGGTYFGYDPFWKNMHENRKALNSKPNVIICANVLNVIFEDWAIENIVRKLASYGCITYIQIYEGNKSGIGKETSKGYQRHQKAKMYEGLLNEYFTKVERKGNIFICK